MSEAPNYYEDALRAANRGAVMENMLDALQAAQREIDARRWQVAQADGFGYAVRLERKADVQRVVGEFLEYPGPAFLEVVIDPDAGVYPMVGPGQSYDKMITGDYIVARKVAPVATAPVAVAQDPHQLF